jgi:heat shock protein HtpX
VPDHAGIRCFHLVRLFSCEHPGHGAGGARGAPGAGLAFPDGTADHSVAATIGAVITWVAQFALFFGGGDDEDGGNPIAALFMALLAPISATIIQLAISRSREFGADSSGAAITADPLALASALRKIEAYSRGTAPATANPSTAHLFISNPFKGGRGVTTLFSTHPSTAERVERLERMASATPPALRRGLQPGLAGQGRPR